MTRGSGQYLFRGFAVWLVIALAEVMHGTLRTLYLSPLVGDLPSRQIGVLTGSLMIVAIACLTVRWIGRNDTKSLQRVGAMWLLLMLGFEVTVGRASGLSWERILSDYLPWRGGFMPAGMLVVAVAPLLARHLRAVNHRTD
ncbi:MAG: hypothetical protein U0Q12_24025 [Vicinamibacterales bacterium]